MYKYLTMSFFYFFISIVNADVNKSENKGIVRGGDFSLQSIDGNVNLKDFRGKVVPIYFGYTYCPDICPTNLSLLSVALDKLTDDELQQVQGIFITLDPDRDNGQHLKEYANYFHKSIIGLYGRQPVVDFVANQYGVYYEKVKTKNSAMNYSIDHTSELYIVGKTGKLHAILPHATKPNEILRAIKKAMKN